MKNPFTAKLRGRLAAAEQERDQARAERDAAQADRDIHAARLREVEPTVEQKARDMAIDLIASAGVRGPILAGEGVLGSKTTPRSKEEFFAAYNRMDDAEEAAAYYERHKTILDE